MAVGSENLPCPDPNPPHESTNARFRSKCSTRKLPVVGYPEAAVGTECNAAIRLARADIASVDEVELAISTSGRTPHLWRTGLVRIENPEVAVLTGSNPDPAIRTDNWRG